jgi:hypothetical protein
MSEFQNIDIEKVNLVAKKWGSYMVPRIQSQIQRLGFVDRMTLLNSIKVKLKKTDGLAEAVTFEYAWYGLMHNVGAKNVFGKGVTLPATHWKSKAINPEIESLATEMAETWSSAYIRAAIPKFNV